MFGSKLRSWMENHIVRPRKKGNKGKNANSATISANNIQNGHKGTSVSILQGDITTTTTTTTQTSIAVNNSISSPARRSEVSPIQCHKTSRIGWQSPQQENSMSPKSDHFLYTYNIKAHTISSSQINSKHSLSNNTPTNCIVSKSKTRYPSSMPCRGTAFKKMDSSKSECNENYLKESKPMMNNCSKKEIKNSLLQHFTYTDEHLTSKNETNANLHSTTNFSKKSSIKITDAKKNYQNNCLRNSNETGYGRILPSKRIISEQYDNINVNTNSNDSNNINNNNHILCMDKSENATSQHYQYHQQHLTYPHGGSSFISPRNTNEINHNMSRNSRTNGSGSTVAPSTNYPLAHVINSLSSPESAYSTGYSTDGTSPGTTYTPPEYYINMRTGTHYFPKGTNNLPVEPNRYKFALNKIEEMSPQDPLPNNQRKIESFKQSEAFIQGFGIPDPHFYTGKYVNHPIFSPITSNNIAIQSYKGFESPSPRQRSRIRTNPWYSTMENSSSTSSNFTPKIVEVDASSSSSGIKSSSDAGGTSDKNEKTGKSSDTESSSSSTEIEIAKRGMSPGTIKRRKTSETSKSEAQVVQINNQESDEDATLNEMMGKFDESYIYEKETDILSDSDPTDCASDLDTGQDAGDECDTDELLDIDYIDTGSVQEIIEKENYKNTGSCSYFNFHVEKRSSRLRRVRKQNEEISKRRKRLMKTRKKSAEGKEKNSPGRHCRESRSLGGTPVSLRRNQSGDYRKMNQMVPLANRCNSLTLTEVHAIRGHYIAIAESEKALAKADLEADVKYKQLIHEAETILVSMKTSSLRETPTPSPRRICQPPPNKRVEMLRNCEADLKREIPKQTDSTPSMNDNCLINKRNRQDILAAQNRICPRKTHITNFINQNVTIPEVRRNTISEFSKSHIPPNIGKIQISPKSSPKISKRRIRSQSPRKHIESDTETDDDNSKKSSVSSRSYKPLKEYERNGNTKNNLNISKYDKNCLTSCKNTQEDLCNRNIIIDLEKISLYDESDYTNRNISESTQASTIVSFSSIDLGCQPLTYGYCPQSEPLKRKIYKGSSTFERIKKSLDLESEIPKQEILNKIQNLRKERQTGSTKNSNSNLDDSISNGFEMNSKIANTYTKQQLILSTIESLKRNLEDQSVELFGLNENTK